MLVKRGDGGLPFPGRCDKIFRDAERSRKQSALSYFSPGQAGPLPEFDK